MQTGLRRGWLLAVLLAGAAFVGCSETKQSSTLPQATDPAASFARVVQNVRHYVSQLQSEPYAAIEDGSYSEVRHTRAVTNHQLQPPTDEGADYRGQITVTTEWIFSFRPPAEIDEQPEEPQSPFRKQGEQEGLAGEGIEVLDPELIADLPHTAPRGLSDVMPKSRAMSEGDKEEQVFQFVFRDNRWELVPEPEKPAPAEDSPDGPLEESTNQIQIVTDAVELALKRQ